MNLVGITLKKKHSFRQTSASHDKFSQSEKRKFAKEAERAGFEPANPCRLHAFQASALSQTTRPLHLCCFFPQRAVLYHSFLASIAPNKPPRNKSEHFDTETGFELTTISAERFAKKPGTVHRLGNVLPGDWPGSELERRAATGWQDRLILRRDPDKDLL